MRISVSVSMNCRQSIFALLLHRVNNGLIRRYHGFSNGEGHRTKLALINLLPTSQLHFSVTLSYSASFCSSLRGNYDYSQIVVEKIGCMSPKYVVVTANKITKLLDSIANIGATNGKKRLDVFHRAPKPDRNHANVLQITLTNILKALHSRFITCCNVANDSRVDGNLPKIESVNVTPQTVSLLLNVYTKLIPLSQNLSILFASDIDIKKVFDILLSVLEIIIDGARCSNRDNSKCGSSSHENHFVEELARLHMNRFGRNFRHAVDAYYNTGITIKGLVQDILPFLPAEDIFCSTSDNIVTDKAGILNIYTYNEQDVSLICNCLRKCNLAHRPFFTSVINRLYRDYHVIYCDKIGTIQEENKVENYDRYYNETFVNSLLLTASGQCLSLLFNSIQHLRIPIPNDIFPIVSTHIHRSLKFDSIDVLRESRRNQEVMDPTLRPHPGVTDPTKTKFNLQNWSVLVNAFYKLGAPSSSMSLLFHAFTNSVVDPLLPNRQKNSAESSASSISSNNREQNETKREIHVQKGRMILSYMNLNNMLMIINGFGRYGLEMDFSATNQFVDSMIIANNAILWSRPQKTFLLPFMDIHVFTSSYYYFDYQIDRFDEKRGTATNVGAENYKGDCSNVASVGYKDNHGIFLLRHRYTLDQRIFDERTLSMLLVWFSRIRYQHATIIVLILELLISKLGMVLTDSPSNAKNEGKEFGANTHLVRTTNPDWLTVQGLVSTFLSLSKLDLFSIVNSPSSMRSVSPKSTYFKHTQGATLPQYPVECLTLMRCIDIKFAEIGLLLFQRGTSAFAVDRNSAIRYAAAYEESFIYNQRIMNCCFAASYLMSANTRWYDCLWRGGTLLQIAKAESIDASQVRRVSGHLLQQLYTCLLHIVHEQPNGLHTLSSDNLHNLHQLLCMNDENASRWLFRESEAAVQKSDKEHVTSAGNSSQKVSEESVFTRSSLLHNNVSRCVRDLLSEERRASAKDGGNTSINLVNNVWLIVNEAVVTPYTIDIIVKVIKP